MKSGLDGDWELELELLLDELELLELDEPPLSELVLPLESELVLERLRTGEEEYNSGTGKVTSREE